MIYIDIKEPKEMVQLLKQHKCPVEVTELLAGDYVFDEWAIERKTTKDFLSSVFDGRIWDQAFTLMTNFEHPIIIIEGGFPVVYDRYTFQKRKAFIGALTRLLKSFKCSVIVTPDKDGTAEFIANLYKSLHIKKDTLKPVIKKGKTPEEIRENILCAIPTIGRRTAKNILKQFPTIRDVANSTLENLANVKGVGVKRAKLILRYLCECD